MHLLRHKRSVLDDPGFLSLSFLSPFPLSGALCPVAYTNIHIYTTRVYISIYHKCLSWMSHSKHIHTKNCRNCTAFNTRRHFTQIWYNAIKPFYWLTRTYWSETKLPIRRKHIDVITPQLFVEVHSLKRDDDIGAFCESLYVCTWMCV